MQVMVVDPNLEEEAATQGLTIVIVNAFGELCAVQKPGQCCVDDA